MTADKTRGLYQRYFVARVDGSSVPGGKHHGCYYFVLDIDHDPHAAAGLRGYADSCEKDYPQLARDLRHVADGNKLVAAKVDLP